MRVLTICNMYPPHHLGGYELSCRDVMRRFAARGHEVAVLTSDVRRDDVDDRAREPYPVYRDLRLYWAAERLLDPSLPRRLAIERNNQKALRRLLDRVRPDVVSAWNMGATSLGLLSTVLDRGTPLALVVCDDWLVYAPRLDAWMRIFERRPRLAAAAERLIGLPCRLPDLNAAAACFVSDFVRARAEQASRWAFPRAAVVHSGIDTADFPATSAADHQWEWRMLYVGRLDARKGVETLLRAMPALPEASLDIVGPGTDEYRRELGALAEMLDVRDRVRFGEAERSELAAFYGAADVVVFPSEWDEPFGLVPVEAMACGTSVVATGTGGSAEVLEDGVNCVLFPPGDAPALAAAIRRLAADPDLRARVVQGGARTAAALDVDRLADRLEQWHLVVGGFDAGVRARGA